MFSTSTSTSASTNVRREFNRLFLVESGITEDEFAELMAYVTNNPNKIPDIEESLNDSNDGDVNVKSGSSASQVQLDKYGEIAYTETVLKFASNKVMKLVTQKLESRIRQRLLEKTKADTEHLYEVYKLQKFVNSDDDDAQRIPKWIDKRRENVGGTVTDQEMDINKDVDEDDTEVQVQPNTSSKRRVNEVTDASTAKKS
ncbi:19131_t:CDS:2 [Rhizophagus irregularis]|nr:19131_t:CDS:2 [Rhizophagus irregularis]